MTAFARQPLKALRIAALYALLFLAGVLLVTDAGAGGNVVLSAQEQQWLKAHDGKIRIAHTPDWPPMDFLDSEGKPQGIVKDYTRLIEKKLNFRFKTVKVKTWEEILVLARKKKIDVISAGQETEERKAYMRWSTPYLNIKTTIIVKKNRKGTLTLDQMRGMKIGVPSKYAVGEFIREKYPYLNVVDVLNSSAGINEVSFGDLDAMVTEVPNALYIIENEKVTNLRLAGDTGFELNHGMGIRKDWPVFAGIIEKALAGISAKEHQDIYTRWIRLETTKFYQTRTFWYTILGTTFAVLLVIGSILLWNRTLKIQVQQRTEALRFNEIGLEALLELNEQTHASIREIIEFAFQQMMRLTKSNFGYLAFDDQDGIIYMVDLSNKKSPGKYTARKLSGGMDRDTIGFWGEAVSSKKPVISNDYKITNPRQKGVPAQYEQISRYMNVPIFNNDKVVVVAGMGNKETDYTDADLRQLTLLTQGMWRLIQRKKAEQTIKKGEKRFRDLVENSPNGVAIIQDGAIVYKNSKQIELIGDIELFAPSGFNRIHQDDLEKTQRFYGQLKKEDLTQAELNFRFYTSSDQDDHGTMKWVNCIATPIEYQDRKALLLITIDMTEAKELERLLIVQDKMASLGHVSAGIAHEIRNPLSGININIRTIEKNYAVPEKTQKTESALEAIRSASKKIDSVIKRVMNFAKPTEPRFKLIDINAPVKEALELTSFSLNKKEIVMLSELDEHLPQCYAEPHLIEEVILNLINNAAEAIMHHEGNRTIRVASTTENEKIILSVEDNGNGIARDLREKIFEPFFTTKEHSTGIGLSLCHRIITDHKGTLRVVPSELGGAKFVITIPVSMKMP